MGNDADADILNELSEIDDIVGEEVTFDEADLDFDLEGEPAAQPEPEAKQPEPEAKQPEPEAKQPEPEAKQPEPEAKQPGKATQRPKAKKPKGESKTVVESAKDSVTEVDEVVVRAKRLRIVADKVVIEPGDISFA